MKSIKLLLLLILSSNVIAQEINFKVENDYINQFGKGSDLVSFIPLFKLSSNTIHNKEQSLEIKKLPPAINKETTAYGFLLFTGLNNSSFEKEVTILVENYTSPNSRIYVDRNGNLDFNDDGIPLTLKEELLLKLSNEDIDSAYYNYKIGRSGVSEENESRLRSRYDSKFPKSEAISAKNWLTNRRLSIRVSKENINGSPITIFLTDNSIDGLFTFQTDRYGDRILIVEGEIDYTEDLTSLLRQAEPIDHNAVFELYGKNYFVKYASKNGDELTLARTNQDTRVMFKDGEDISSYTINLLDGSSVVIEDIIRDEKHLLIDVGGTWCGGCIKQEPKIKELYNNSLVEVVGLFDYDTPQSINKYVENHDIKWPVARVDSTFKEMFRINSYPTYILVSPEGKIVLADTNSKKIADYLNQ